MVNLRSIPNTNSLLFFKFFCIRFFKVIYVPVAESFTDVWSIRDQFPTPIPDYFFCFGPLHFKKFFYVPVAESFTDIWSIWDQFPTPILDFFFFFFFSFFLAFNFFRFFLCPSGRKLYWCMVNLRSIPNTNSWLLFFLFFLFFCIRFLKVIYVPVAESFTDVWSIWDQFPTPIPDFFSFFFAFDF